VVVPYSICEFAAALVCQVIVAPVLETLLTAALEIVNCGGGGGCVVLLTNPEQPLLTSARLTTNPATMAGILPSFLAPLTHKNGFIDAPQHLFKPSWAAPATKHAHAFTPPTAKFKWQNCSKQLFRGRKKGQSIQ